MGTHDTCCNIRPLQKEQLRMTSFTELSLSSALQQRLATAEFIIPTPIQAAGPYRVPLRAKMCWLRRKRVPARRWLSWIPVIEMLQARNRRKKSASWFLFAHAASVSDSSQRRV